MVWGEEEVVPQGGTLDFKWQRWSNGDKNQNPKKSLGLPTKPPKIPGPKINPQKSHAKFRSLKNFQNALNDITWKIKTLENIRNWYLKNPNLNQATPKNTCQIFLPKKIPRIKNFTPQKILWSSPSLEIWSTRPPLPQPEPPTASPPPCWGLCMLRIDRTIIWKQCWHVKKYGFRSWKNSLTVMSTQWLLGTALELKLHWGKT